MEKKEEQLDLVRVGGTAETSTYRIVPAGTGGDGYMGSISSEYGRDSCQHFTDLSEMASKSVTVLPISVGGKAYSYVSYGHNDLLPYDLINSIMGNMVTAECQHFNTMACYGRGVRFIDRKTKKDIDDAEILDFCLANSLHEVFMQQSTDMKFFFFSVTCIILSRDGSKIVEVHNKDASFCRLEYAPSTKSGRIEHVFFADWRSPVTDGSKVEVIPLLDTRNPLGDLRVRMGQRPAPDTGKVKDPCKERKFAILCRVPTPGCLYYPAPYYTSIFRDAWFDIYRLIGIGKRFMIKNTSAPRVQIEIHNEYWDNVCDIENIMDETKRAQRKQQEKQNIIEFVTGVENAGKAMISGYYTLPDGKECRMVRITPLNDASKKEGGNWSDDMSEASNALCFAFGIHPNLVGATPGKSQMNNSGSDKRELFTLKQSLEVPFHDVMCKPYHVILHYNGWNDRATVDVPMILLTTLDKKNDAQRVSVNNNEEVYE